MLSRVCFAKKLIPLMVLLWISGFIANADYVGKSVTGDFENQSSWVPRGWGDAYPQVNGNVTDLMVINGHITRNGALNPVSVTVQGTFIINGNYTNNQWSGLTVKSGGRVEIFGNLIGSAGVDVKSGGVLIVHGNFSSTGSSVGISGDMVVKGDFSTSSGTTVNNQGNLVVGGDFSHSGGGLSVKPTNLYILNPNAVITHPGWGDINNGNYGDAEDFVNNESGNTTLYDLVADQLGLLDIVYTWTGSANRNWHNSRNWNKGLVPNINSSVVIENVANAPVVQGGLEANAKIINMATGASLTLNAGARMTVTGNITNTGASIVLKNSVDASSSFLVKGTLTAPITSEWTYPTGKYIYLGHCVDGNLRGSFDAINALVYRVVNNAWVPVPVGEVINTNPLEGYSVGFKTALGASTKVSHTGTLRQGNYSYGLGANWYLIANPYATYLDVESSGFEIGADFKTVYVAQMGTGSASYATYNVAQKTGANDGSRYIAPGQSFWIRNYTGTPTLRINKSARSHATGTLKAASVVDDVLRLKVSNGTATDETVLLFRANGSESFSGVYDSEKRFVTGASEMSLYTKKGSRSASINTLPDELDDRAVPLYINIGSANGGTFTLSATNLDVFMPSVDVYLIDKVASDTVNLREKPNYSFTSAAVSGQNRFELSFAHIEEAPSVPTELGNTLGDGAKITAIGLNNKAIVKVKDASFNGNVTIEVLDALGKLHSRTISSTTRTEVSAPSNTQFFVVKVTYKNRVETFKIVTKMN